MADQNRVQPEVFLIPYDQYDPTVHNIEYRYFAPTTFRSGESEGATAPTGQEFERFYPGYGRPRPFYPGFYGGYHPYYGGYGYHPYYHPFYGGYHPYYGGYYHHESSPSR